MRNMPRQVGRRATLPGISGRISFDERGPKVAYWKTYGAVVKGGPRGPQIG